MKKSKLYNASDMYYDIPKLQNFSIVNEAKISIAPNRIVASNDLGNKENLPKPEAPDLGGYVFITGTPSASGISLSTVQSQQITFIPRDGAIPYYEIELQHTAKVLEQVTFPQEKK